MKTKSVLITVLFNLFVGIGSEQGKALASDLNKTYTNDKNVVEFVPVKVAKENEQQAYCYNQSLYLPLEKKSLKIQEFQFQKFADKKLGVKFDLSEKEAKGLQKLSQKYKNHKLAVLVNGKVVSVPSLKNVIMGEGFEITVNDVKGFENMFQHLVN